MQKIQNPVWFANYRGKFDKNTGNKNPILVDEAQQKFNVFTISL